MKLSESRAVITEKHKLVRFRPYTFNVLMDFVETRINEVKTYAEETGGAYNSVSIHNIMLTKKVKKTLIENGYIFKKSLEDAYYTLICWKNI